MSTVDKTPVFEEADAVRIARKKYGISVSASPLPSERDQNFYLRSTSGEQYVLKIANALERKGVLEFQNSVMDHLIKKSGRELCPRALTDISGRTISTVEDSAGFVHFVRLVTYIEGTTLARVNPQTPELLFDFGRFIGQLVLTSRSLRKKDFQENLIWNLKNGPATVRFYMRHIPDRKARVLLKYYLSQFEKTASPLLPSLAQGIIHNDANDYNVIISFPDSSPDSFGKRSVAGIIDFGDTVYSYELAELAVALAYVMLKKKDPLRAASPVVAGYNSLIPLKNEELRILFYLSALRLCLSVAISACQKKLRPGDNYLTISERDAWNLLQRLRFVPPNLVYYTLRDACGMTACPESRQFVRWIRKNQPRFSPVVKTDPKPAKAITLDLSPGSLFLQDVPFLKERRVFASSIQAEMEKAGAKIGIGRYAETRLAQTHDLTEFAGLKTDEGGLTHLGLDIFAKPGTPVFSPLPGTVSCVQKRKQAEKDGGSTLILEHTVNKGKIVFHTLYRHLSRDSLAKLSPGKKLKRGEKIGKVAGERESGGWPPHVHFQVVLDLLGLDCSLPGAARYTEKKIWLSLCPDPNLIAQIHDIKTEKRPFSAEEIMELRKKHVGKSLSLTYKKPLKIVRGAMQYLYDDTGRRYLDAINNVPNVGHCHPEVVRAAAQQMAVLKTNTRYLHDNLVRYAQRLSAKMPEPLRVCYIVNSGSEANDLALRLARNYTGQKDVVVVDNAYHGHLTSLIEISPYKFNGPGGSGKPPHTHVVPMPDLYRGAFLYGDPKAGKKYAEHIRLAIEQVQKKGRKIAAFICESLPGVGGHIVLPDGYLKYAYQHVRSAGGVCIADEVQVGFARLGTHFWGFETQGVIPDIVTLGKPIGDGHPLAAVVTTPEIADAFATGMEYFNTYGGNPVSCAVGLAVLDVIEKEKLQENALKIGSYLKSRLKELQTKYPLIGDVRGLGLFLGVELVKDRKTRAPAPEHTAYIVERMKEEGILINLEGPRRNVLKIKPPLVFTKDDADKLVNSLDRILAEDPVCIT